MGEMREKLHAPTREVEPRSRQGIRTVALEHSRGFSIFSRFCLVKDALVGYMQPLHGDALPLAVDQAPVAQSDRASDYGSEGWGFESSRARH